MKDLEQAQKYLRFKILLKDENSLLNLEVKESLKIALGEIFGKNLSLLKNIFIIKPINFGNHIAGLNNIFYYSEILGIKNIYLNAEFDWYIKKDILTDKIHISLLPKKKINCNSPETFCGRIFPTFFNPKIIKPERRSLYVKDEIKRNLPKIKTRRNDLYIYIRAYTFQLNGTGYSPAPYCFYQTIISKFKFRDIYVVSAADKNSPLIKRLLLDYPKIKFMLKSVQEDIAILTHAYNLVNAVSSFSQAAIAFNDNLINLFEYEVYKIEQSILFFHYDNDKLNRRFNIYRMKPSEEYYIKTYNWGNTDEEIKLLFEDNCKYGLRKTKYTKTILE